MKLKSKKVEDIGTKSKKSKTTKVAVGKSEIEDEINYNLK